ncbi:D-erythronate dehydrogenase [Oceanomicrobium pacificus]|uniref:NAD-dependent epimerase/dehydratase family protein n=1 Tax=Oceanomicrobium pacificus TaxID=2692916 RepID=A0A6B0TZ41_9RHOB|nr:D-erythronate dehydrogenase [Oceanomicrobium pacificus]MXU66678.1 NAD-dependent epimerase/dehydratase family protein [Oceanomicrobium pacificus]
MRILILGAGGMIGRKLAAALAQDGLGGQPVDEMVLADIVAPAPVALAGGGPVNCLAVDLGADGTAEALVAAKPDVIFHLAAIVSFEAEQNLEKGYRINLDGSRALCDAIRDQHATDPAYCPRFVFASSLAVFGPPFPDPVPDSWTPTPATSYGTQKLMIEALVNDFSRRGILDGISLRLPTICVRPGAPNAAASGFFSGIIREPLTGQEADLPVPRTVRHWFASPRAAVGFMCHAAALDTGQLGPQRALNLPGLSCSVGEQIDALERVAGAAVVARIKERPNPDIARIVDGWPAAYAPERALALGFRAEISFDEIIEIFIADELDGQIA